MDSITGESLADLPHYPSAVNCIRFFGDGRQLAVAIGDWMSNGRGEVSAAEFRHGKDRDDTPLSHISWSVDVRQ